MKPWWVSIFVFSTITVLVSIVFYGKIESKYRAVVRKLYKIWYKISGYKQLAEID